MSKLHMWPRSAPRWFSRIKPPEGPRGRTSECANGSDALATSSFLFLLESMETRKVGQREKNARGRNKNAMFDMVIYPLGGDLS